jgi:hypothetical protein
MKKLFCILLVIFPAFVFAQQYKYKSSPLDYSWTYVGDAGFSAGLAIFTSIAFSPSGEPYVAYNDQANSDKASVMKFDGSNWVTVGNAGFTAGEAVGPSLAFSPVDGEPYVAYSDTLLSYKASVMKFNGTSWVTVGDEGFSAGYMQGISIAFSLSGQPYVAYTDGPNGGRATVMKYDSVFVGMNESQESGLILYPNPATDKITIETSDASKNNNLVIINIDGKELIAHSLSNQKTVIDINTLPGGVYFVRLTNDKTVEVEKMIKQ